MTWGTGSPVAEFADQGVVEINNLSSKDQDYYINLFLSIFVMAHLSQLFLGIYVRISIFFVNHMIICHVFEH